MQLERRLRAKTALQWPHLRRAKKRNLVKWPGFSIATVHQDHRGTLILYISKIWFPHGHFAQAYNHSNWGARKQKLVLKRGKVKTPWKQQIYALFVATFSTIKISFQPTDMVNRSGHLLRTRHEAHRSFHNSWGLALQNANDLLTRHFKGLSRSPQFAGMVHATQRCRSVVSIQIYQLLGSRCGRVTHSQNGLPLHSKK